MKSPSSPAKRRRERAFFIRTKRARYSIPIPLMHAASTSWWAPITFSISRRKVATRMVSPSPWLGFAITIAMRKATWSTSGRSTWLPKVPVRAARRSTTREQLRLLCSDFESRESLGDADQGEWSASYDRPASFARHCWLGCSQRYPGTLAQVPRVPGCLLCNRQRDRNLRLNRNLSSRGPCRSLRGLAVILRCKPRAPLPGQSVLDDPEKLSIGENRVTAFKWLTP